MIFAGKKESSLYSLNPFCSSDYYFILSKAKLEKNKPPKPHQNPSQPHSRKILQSQTESKSSKGHRGDYLDILRRAWEQDGKQVLEII